MARWPSIAPVLAGLLLICAPAHAQDPPGSLQNVSRADVFIGFEGKRDLGIGKQPWSSSPRLGIDMNLSDRVALVLAPSLGVGKSSIGGSFVDYAMVAGPRLRFRTQKKVVPFAQILAGIGRGSVRSEGTPSSPPLHATTFLMSFAGGVDIALTPRFAWRVVQLEQRNRIGGASDNHHLAASTGLVIRFGRRK
jgi:hypothetical protein